MKLSTENRPTWIVAGELGPSQWPFQHETQDAAMSEAVRLTRMHGGTFYVLEVKALATRNDVILRHITGEELPF